MITNFERAVLNIVRYQDIGEAQHQLDHTMLTISETLKLYNDPDNLTFQVLKNVLIELQRCQRLLQKRREAEYC